MAVPEADPQYVMRVLFDKLPDSDGHPLTVAFDRDLTIVGDVRYYGQVAENALGNSGDVPLPGLEDEAVMLRKQQAGVAIARRNNGGIFLDQVKVATYNEDTARSLFRLVRRGEFIPIDSDDSKDSLYLRTGDGVSHLFEAAERERVPLSATRRQRGAAELMTKFEDRDPDTVLRLATLVGRNSARLRGMWLGQLATTTKGFSHLTKAQRESFINYALSRPPEYFKKPDLLSIVAPLARKKQPKSDSRVA